MHDRPAKYVSNHDGDTVTVILDQDFYDNKQINLRLANVWAPELHQPGGEDVRAFVFKWFVDRVQAAPHDAWPFMVYTHQTPKGDRELKTFDRYVATVMTFDEKQSLNADVMKYILEKGYSGGTGAPVK